MGPVKILNNTSEKYRYVHDFLMGPDSLLFIVDMQGQDIPQIIQDCISQWATIYDIQKVDFFRSKSGYKASYFNKSTGGLKAVCHVEGWDETWILMAEEFGATTVIFRRAVRDGVSL